MADYCQLGDLFARKQYTFFKVTFRTMICLFYTAYVAIKKSTIHHLLAFYIKRFPVRGEQIDKYIKHFIYIYIKRFVRNEIINFSSSSQLISSLTIKTKLRKRNLKRYRRKSYSTWAIIFLVVAKFFLSVRRERN